MWDQHRLDQTGGPGRGRREEGQKRRQYPMIGSLERGAPSSLLKHGQNETRVCSLIDGEFLATHR